MQHKVVIAVVDDDEAFRTALESLLRANGYQVLGYPGGQAFLESPGPAQTQCLISDIQMPGISGPQLNEALRAQGWRIPVIFVTAHPDEIHTRAPGVIACLAKPFQPEGLLSYIDIALNQTPLV
ncbi:response regulator transcription factor [Pseudomonas sp. HMWF021]|uniref:response regulator transcription factor n=1 Tax=Pseudomonas sp. HMWF021 TaxID=2056857 RepID=UPI000D3677FA|nr:response regulator [Pseudomonas sp. HMWF021]PTT30323.1 two-component system response regulator [Pseudomonas sp. HMWF021]